MQENEIMNQISLVVHVGAHIGQEVDVYRQLGVQQIVWIEADTEIYHRLQDNIRMKESNSSNRINHIFINALVGESNDDIIKFYPFNNDGQSSSRYKPTQLLKDTWVGLDTLETPKEIRTYRLDSILESIKLDEGRYSNAKLVIDVQGGEYQVLIGTGQYIDKFNFIEVEVSKEEIYEGQKLFGYIDNFLTLKNFKRNENNINDIPWHGNVIYHRNKTEEILSGYCANYFSALLTFKQIESNPAFQNHQTKFLEYCAKNRNLSYSQLFQDLLVLQLMHEKSQGYFVEFGAADGVFLSNTYLLEKDFNWSGIVCEPAISWKKALSENRSSIIDYRCVFHASGLNLPFLDVKNNELSTLQSYSQLDLHAANRSSGNEYLVETVSLEDLLDQHNAPHIIDYLSIDTEGSEFDILKVFNFKKYQFRIITVEHNHTEMRSEIYNLLICNGYTRIFKDLSGFDDWYVLQPTQVLK
jgi:FkbM family methyltransferase